MKTRVRLKPKVAVSSLAANIATDLSPSDTHIATVRRRSKRVGANDFLSPSGDVPQPSPSTESATTSEYDQRSNETHCTGVNSLVVRIRELNARRKSLIEGRIRITNGLTAYARCVLGFDPTASEKDRKNTSARAASLINGLLKHGPVDGPSATIEAVGSFVSGSRGSIKACDALQKSAEKEMKKLAAGLPGAAVAASIRGFGLAAFARIVGETGSFSNYSTVSKLWSRMGMAPPSHYDSVTLKGERCNKCPRQRKSVMYIVTTSLVKLKSPQMLPFYEEAKAKKLAEGWGKSPQHRHNHALRVMGKELLRVMWVAWKAQENAA